MVVQEILRTDTGENCSSQGVKEQRRDKNFCGTCEQKMTDGTNATEFKNNDLVYPIGGANFRGHVAIKGNSKV